VRWRRQDYRKYRRSSCNQTNTYSFGTESRQSDFQVLSGEPGAAARTPAGLTIGQNQHFFTRACFHNKAARFCLALQVYRPREIGGIWQVSAEILEKKGKY